MIGTGTPAAPSPPAACLEAVCAIGERAFWLSGWLHDPSPRSVRLVAVSPEGARTEIASRAVSFYSPPDDPRAPESDAEAPTVGFHAYVELERASAAVDGWAVEFHSAGQSTRTVAQTSVEYDPERAWQHLRELIRAEPLDEAALEHQVLPAVGRMREHGSRIEEIIDYGTVPQAADASVLIAVRRVDRIQHQLADLVRDPALRAAELIFVLAPGVDPDLREVVQELHSLYDLPFRLALLSAPASRARAVNLAAEIARGKVLILLSGDVIPAGPGWLQAMFRSLEQSPTVGAVGPKLLREDASIAHAGTVFERRGAGLPGWRRKLPFAGLARGIVAAGRPRPVQALSDQCMLIAADLFAAVGGFSELYFGGDREGDDLCLRLIEAGRVNWYVPDAECYLLDRPDKPPRRSPLGARFDDWLFDHRHRESLTEAETARPSEPASVAPRSRRRVLYVANNHPSIRPGGVQTYADELYRSMRESGAFDPMYVSRIGPPHSNATAHEGTRFGLADDGDDNLYYFHTGSAEFDRTMWTARRKGLYVEDWREFLLVHKPDVVHFHHALFLGFDMIRETRRTLPDAAIVFTLHDFLAICMHAGQMVRTGTYELCDHASPRRCNHCFPKISTQTFFRRQRFLLSALESVDVFISPSEVTRRRYADWGIPAEKIRFEDYGRLPVEPVPDPPDAGRRRRIGYFGRMTHFKGVDLLLEAMVLLGERGVDVQLLIGGANLELMPAAFQDRIHVLLERVQGQVHFAGGYAPEELPGLLSDVDWVVVPSIWWENAPLVIQEAKMHRRPVICSDVGGMAEKVRDGVDGLHFRVGDADALAETISRAVDAPGLWDEIRASIAEPHPMDRHLAAVTGIYSELLTRAPASSGDGISADATSVAS